MKKTKIVVLIVPALLIIILAIYDIAMYWNHRELLRAKKTEARMLDLMGVLEAEQPQRLEPELLRPILAKYNRLDCLEDAWGNPFVIESRLDGREILYTIISLGRDSRRGRCCRKWVESWDDDAVLSEKGWLQVWYPKEASSQRP